MIKREQVEKVIGKSFADKLDDNIFYVSDTWSYTRREMVDEVGCANFIAAVKLSKVLRKLNIYSPFKLSKTDPFSLARAKGIGETALFVACCILDTEGYSVIEWWGWKDNTAKFSSLKKARKRKVEV